MNAVFIVPTGVGAEIGGHAGDATPAAKLIASVCDTLIVHPNVVNASDINEMTDNMLYVEGSMLDEFLQDKTDLHRVLGNRILLAVNSPVDAWTINAASAARATIGADVEIIELREPLKMYARIEHESATGTIEGLREMIAQVGDYDFDALAVATPIMVDDEVALHYLRHGGVNPWGGVEAVLSKALSYALQKPVAHAPVADPESAIEQYNEVVDPRMGAELVSRCYLHCVLKGLHRAPVRGPGLACHDIDCLITPHGLCGPPHEACLEREIPIIVVNENRTVFNEMIDAIYAETYLEAAGIMMCMKAGIDWRTTQRPLEPTVIHR